MGNRTGHKKEKSFEISLPRALCHFLTRANAVWCSLPQTKWVPFEKTYYGQFPCYICIDYLRAFVNWRNIERETNCSYKPMFTSEKLRDSSEQFYSVWSHFEQY